MSGNWRECRKTPCPVCGHRGWCSVTLDGIVCHCMRQPSERACASGGWIHYLVERPKRKFIPTAPRRPVRPMLDMAVTMAGFRREFEEYRNGDDIFDSLIAIASDLRLNAGSIDRLNVGRSAHHMAWAFPMLDALGNCIGIRLRRYGSSDKFSVTGSRDGLFYDPGLQPLESVSNGLKGRELVIVEGATDCIAGYELGLPCVGRSSCGTGGELLRALCGRMRVTRVTIVTDNDRYKARIDGTPYRPGIDGAESLAKQLGRCYRLVTPPQKDLREWFYAGLTAETFWMVADLQKWRIK